jgi:hypothetical protein
MFGESAVRDPQRLETILAKHTEIADAPRDGDARRLRSRSASPASNEHWPSLPTERPGGRSNGP